MNLVAVCSKVGARKKVGEDKREEKRTSEK